MEKVAGPVERDFGKGRISPEPRQQEIIGPDHIEYRGVRAGEFSEKDVERFSDQRQAVSWRGRGHAKFGKHDPMALEDQRAAVHQRAVKIENDQFHGFP